MLDFLLECLIACLFARRSQGAERTSQTGGGPRPPRLRKMVMSFVGRPGGGNGGAPRAPRAPRTAGALTRQQSDADAGYTAWSHASDSVPNSLPTSALPSRQSSARLLVPTHSGDVGAPSPSAQSAPHARHSHPMGGHRRSSGGTGTGPEDGAASQAVPGAGDSGRHSSGRHSTGLSVCLSLCHSLSLSLSLSHTCTLSLSLSHSHTLSLSHSHTLSLSLTLSLTRTLSPCLSLAHTGSGGAVIAGNKAPSSAAGSRPFARKSQELEPHRRGRRRQMPASRLIDAKSYMFAVWADHIHEQIKVGVCPRDSVPPPLSVFVSGSERPARQRLSRAFE
jgi:hypothetical protein